MFSYILLTTATMLNDPLTRMREVRQGRAAGRQGASEESKKIKTSSDTPDLSEGHHSSEFFETRIILDSFYLF